MQSICGSGYLRRCIMDLGSGGHLCTCCVMCYKLPACSGATQDLDFPNYARIVPKFSAALFTQTLSSGMRPAGQLRADLGLPGRQHDREVRQHGLVQGPHAAGGARPNRAAQAAVRQAPAPAPPGTGVHPMAVSMCSCARLGLVYVQCLSCSMVTANCLLASPSHACGWGRLLCWPPVVLIATCCSNTGLAELAVPEFLFGCRPLMG